MRAVVLFIVLLAFWALLSGQLDVHHDLYLMASGFVCCGATVFICARLKIIDAENNWTYFEREKGVFSLNYTPNVKGEIKISAKIENGGDSYHTIMIYKAGTNQQIS